MQAPLETTLFIVLVAAGWHWRFSRAARRRRAESFSRDSLKAGVLLVALGIAVFGGAIAPPTTAEMLATIAFDAGGGALLVLGLIGWATSNDSGVELQNLTGETLVFVDPEGELLFTLLPQFGRAVATLPPPLPGLYLIVSPALLETDEAATRSDLRIVDPASSKRASDGRRLLVRRLAARTCAISQNA